MGKKESSLHEMIYGKKKREIKTLSRGVAETPLGISLEVKPGVSFLHEMIYEKKKREIKAC